MTILGIECEIFTALSAISSENPPPLFNDHKEKLLLNMLEDKVHRSLNTIYTILKMTVELHRFDRTTHKKACNIIILSSHV